MSLHVAEPKIIFLGFLFSAKKCIFENCYIKVEKRMKLTNNELKRYNRHIIMPEIGLQGQQKIKDARVLVVGAGGLGSPVLLYLTAAGVGTIGIVDFDTVSETNLQRQILYDTDDIGKPKVEIAKRKLSAQNPKTNFNIYNFPLDNFNAIEIIDKYDVVVDCTDNFSTRFLINDATSILNKPLVFGAIYKFEGQVSVFNYKNGPSYRCLVPEMPENEEGINCAEIGVIGVIPGIIGSLQASECIKVITGIGNILSGQLFVIDVLNFSTNIISFPKSENIITKLGDYNYICETDTIKVPEIDGLELKKMLVEKSEIQIIDIRSKEQFNEYNLGGINVSENEILSEIGVISNSKKVIFVCTYGTKSEKLIKTLIKEFKFSNIYNLFGGINSYKALDLI